MNKVATNIFDSEEVLQIEPVFEIEPVKGKNPGRPELIGDPNLLSRRDALISLLEGAWGELGWDLRHVKTAGDVRGTFRGLERYPSLPYILQALLRPSDRPTTPRDLCA